MNQMEAHNQAKLKKHLDLLGLTPKNRAMAEEYLRSDPENRDLLKNAEAQSFRDTSWIWRFHCGEYLSGLARSGDKDRIDRLMRLYWAIAKSTAVFAMAYEGSQMGLENAREHRIRILGAAAEAAMEAEYFAVVRPEPNWVSWLYETAEKDPYILLEAQQLGGCPYPNMKLLLAGVLLGCMKKPLLPVSALPFGSSTYVHRQKKILADCLSASVSALFPSMTEQDKSLLATYIACGNTHQPMPRLACESSLAVDAKSAVHAELADEYLCGLLGTACFLAAHLDGTAYCAMRVLLRASPYTILHSIFRMVPGEHILKRLDMLVQELPGGKTTMLLYVSGFRNGIDLKLAVRIAERCAEAEEEARLLADSGQYSVLDELIPCDPEKYLETLSHRVMALFQKSVLSGGEAVVEFLKGSQPFSELEPALANVQVMGHVTPSDLTRQLCRYRDKLGTDEFFIRCAAVLTFVFEGRGLDDILRTGRNLNDTMIEELMNALLSRSFPVKRLINSMGYLSDIVYLDEEQQLIYRSLLRCLVNALYIEDLAEAARDGSVFTRKFSIQAMGMLTGEGVPEETLRKSLLACTADSSKYVRVALLNVLAAHPRWIEHYQKLLSSKKTGERTLGAQLLAMLPGDHSEVLNAALAKEKSAKVADVIREALSAGGNAVAATQPAGPEALAERIVTATKRKKIQWLTASPLPGLRYQDQPEKYAPDIIRDAILVSYADLGKIGRSETAAQLVEYISEKDLTALAVEVLDKWLENRAESKHKWVMAFAAVYGGSSVTKLLTKAIQDWPQQGRGAIACDAVMALAISTDPGALMVVDSISRKFKFRQVKAAAVSALECAAQELGITADELADRVVPDLGFDENGCRRFDYGNRSFVVRLTPSMELDITNDQGKTVKNMPAPGKTDDPAKSSAAYEEFKTLKKQIRSTVSAQKTRLEAALSVQRCWREDAWKDLFVRNPVMHQFAISLIWGIYESDTLITTFRYMEDGSFNTVDEEEFYIPDGAMIGLVHPVELDEKVLNQWREQLEDYEITQSIQQLDRPVYQLDADQGNLTSVEDFGGIILNGLSLGGKLMGMGWFRGSVQDGGGYYEFYREDPYMGIAVELNFSGCFMGDENAMVTVYDAVFYRSGTVTRGSYCYDKPQGENIFCLGEIPERYYSEILLQIYRAIASGTERDPEWKKKRENPS